MRCPYCDQKVSAQRWPRHYRATDSVICEHVAFHIPPQHHSMGLHPSFPKSFQPPTQEFATLWARALVEWLDPEDGSEAADEQSQTELRRSRLVTLLRASRPVDASTEISLPPPIEPDLAHWCWRRWPSLEEMMLAAHDPRDPYPEKLDLYRGSEFGAPEETARRYAAGAAHRVMVWCLNGFRRGREYERVTWEKWRPPGGWDVEPPEEGWDYDVWDDETPGFRGDVLFRPSSAESELSRQDAISELRFVTHLLGIGLAKLTNPQNST